MNEIVRHLANKNKYRAISDLIRFDKEYFENRQEEGIRYLIEDFGLTRVPENYFKAYFRSCYLSETDWAKKFWRYANELTRLIFDLGLADGKEVVVDYNGEQKVIAASAVPNFDRTIYHCWDWVQWSQYAIIARDNRQINNLQRIDTETMFAKIAEHGSLNPDLIDTLLHSFHLFLLGKEYSQALVLAKDIIDKISNQPEVYYKNYLSFNSKKHQVDKLIVPYYRCLESVLEGNQSQFDERLYEGLQLHKEWAMLKPEKGQIPNSNNHFSFVSIKMATVCSLAFDRGMSINVQSDYIPAWLIQNEIENAIS